MEQLSPSPSLLTRWVEAAEVERAEIERFKAEREAAQAARTQAIAQAFAESEIIRPLIEQGIIDGDTPTTVTPSRSEPTGCQVVMTIAEHAELIATYKPQPNWPASERFTWYLRHTCQQCGTTLEGETIDPAEGIYPAPVDLGESALDLATIVASHYANHDYTKRAED